MGNFDWKGGMSQLSTYNYMGEKDGQPYNFKDMHPGKVSPFGTDIIRHGDYEKTTTFKEQLEAMQAKRSSSLILCKQKQKEKQLHLQK